MFVIFNAAVIEIMQMNVTVFAVTDTHIATRKPLRAVPRIMYRIALRFESVNTQRVLTFQDGERQ